MENVELCPNGRCSRVRMGEKHGPHAKFSNKFTKIKDELKNALYTIGILVFIFGITIYLIPDENLSYDKKLTAITAGFGFMITIIFALTNNYYKFIQLQKDTLIKIFDLLSREDVRKARKVIHDEYCRLKKAKLDIVFKNSNEHKELEDRIDLVLSSLDQVSVLVLNGLIDKDLFFDTYGELIVRDWKTLKTEIEQRQKLNAKTLKHFTALKNEFENRNDIGNTEPYCED